MTDIKDLIARLNQNLSVAEYKLAYVFSSSDATADYLIISRSTAETIRAILNDTRESLKYFDKGEN